MSDYSQGGLDLDNLLEARAGRTPLAATTNFRNQGQDFNDRYLIASHPDALNGPNLGFKINGVDVGDVFGANPASFILASKISDTDSSVWNQQQNVTIRLTFSSSSARDDFFAYGGMIRVQSSRTGGSTTGQTGQNNSIVSSVLTNSGIVMLRRYETTTNGGGNPTSVGYADLTSSNQTLYTNSSTGGYYSGTFTYTITARLPSSTTLDITMDYYQDFLGDCNGALTMNMSELRHSTQSSPSYANIEPL